MKATEKLHRLGQSLWLDNITRSLLKSGQLKRYIDEFWVTGLTSNPTIFDQALKAGSDYDSSIAKRAGRGQSEEDIFFEIALEDLKEAAALFAPIHRRTGGLDGFVSLEVSPLLVQDTKGTIAVAKMLHDKAACPNLMIKIPGTPEGLPAIEESIFAGIPINVTLLFSDEQYRAAADAFTRGIERRIDTGLPANVPSVASIFVSRWDGAVASKVPEPLRNKLGIAMAQRTYKVYRDLLSSERWMRICNEGATPQRLLWASTGTKDKNASDTLYIDALASPFTVNTMPEKTLTAFADHGRADAAMALDGDHGDAVLAQFAKAGIDTKALAKELQDEGGQSFVKSWTSLIDGVRDKSMSLKKAS